jgi:3-deoxy-D-manno-oct-2-ulosonic acid (Kdo) hydroxylase
MLGSRMTERDAVDGASAVELLTLDAGIDLAAADVQRDAIEALESGHVVFLPTFGFELTVRERELITDLHNILSREPDGANGRPTIIFEPRRGGIKKHNYAFSGWRPVRAEVRQSVLPELEAMMARFGGWAEALIARLFPRYVSGLGRDRITYRPTQRSDVQPLHVDSAYGYPTQGRGMLRVFSNIDPLRRPRIWHVGEPFERFARRFVHAARRRDPSWSTALLARLGLVGGSQTPYDMMIADLRRLGKRDEEYQRTAPRRVVEFPSGSTWLAITDLVLHGAVRGQHSLDQTFFLPAAEMCDPGRSSLRILERLSGRRLV